MRLKITYFLLGLFCLPDFVLGGCIEDFAKLKAELGLTSRQIRPLLEDGPVGRLQPLNKHAAGTTGGSWYRDEKGQEWFVKKDGIHPELQSGAEVVTAKLYGFLGYKTPETAIITIDGERAVASKSLGEGLIGTTLDGFRDPYFRQLHYFAALFKDWDRLKMGPNNVILPGGDRPYGLLDFGGSLGSRAQGEHKPGKVFSEAIGSFERDISGEDIIKGFRVSSLPKDHPWRQPLEVSDRESIVRKLRLMTDEVIDHVVSQAHYHRKTDARYLKSALSARRDALIDFLEKQDDTSSLQPTFGWEKSQAEGFFEQSRSLSSEELAALDDFVNDRTYPYVAPFLNGGNFPFWKDVLAYGKVVKSQNEMKELLKRKIVPALDRTMEKQPSLPNGLVLHRGKTTQRPVARHPIGEVYSERSYQSTSLDPAIANFYARFNQMKFQSTDSYNVLIQQFVVRGDGVKGVFVPTALRAYRENTSNNRSEIEEEILLARNTKFRVISRDEQQRGPQRIIVEVVEVLGN